MSEHRGQPTTGHDARRVSMIRAIEGRGVTDRRVLAALDWVHREEFVAPELAQSAYDDHPLPIGSGQTISQPYVVAIMAEAAEITPDDRVAEIGTGSGYGAAVLARLAAAVWTVERVPELADRAAERLRSGGFGNVEVVVGDGTSGCPDAAPFDAIVVTAAPAEVPPALVGQLVDGGRLVIPVGQPGTVQHLYRIRRTRGGSETEDLGRVRFVPLIDGSSDV